MLSSALNNLDLGYNHLKSHPIQGRAVQKVTNTIHWINLYSVPNNHLLASDLSSE